MASFSSSSSAFSLFGTDARELCTVSPLRRRISDPFQVDSGRMIYVHCLRHEVSPFRSYLPWCVLTCAPTAQSRPSSSSFDSTRSVNVVELLHPNIPLTKTRHATAPSDISEEVPGSITSEESIRHERLLSALSAAFEETPHTALPIRPSDEYGRASVPDSPRSGLFVRGETDAPSSVCSGFVVH